MTCMDYALEVWLADPTLEHRAEVVERYHYLCKRGARKFTRRQEDRADFEQVAVIGLIKAVDRYRCAAGTPFEAYAWLTVLGELLHYVRDVERFVRIPRRVRELERYWRKTRDALVAELGREPSEREIIEKLAVSPSDVAEIHRVSLCSGPISLDDLSPMQAASVCYTLDMYLDRLDFEVGLRHLSPVERVVVEATYRKDWTTLEIAKMLGYSERHVSRLRRVAFKKLFDERLASSL
ncbi:MAG: sigma-70 family RNA polymerase sigma factor [Vulcanimicrobiaceae bacterium]